MNNALIVNLFSGPGSGKSSTCAGLFSWLKWQGVECEMAMEYAKEKVWEGSLNVLDNQIYIFGKQHHRIFRLKEKVSVVVTDSPLLLSLIYDSDNNVHLRNLVLNEVGKCNNLNIFLNRKKKYCPNGRIQNEQEAKAIDDKIINMFFHLQLPYEKIDGCPESIPIIGNGILSIIGNTNENV